MELTKQDTTYYLTPVVDYKERIDFEIGDSKQADFYPQFKTMHWGNECNFSARLIDNSQEVAVVSQTDSHVIYSTSTHEARFYTKPGDEQGQFEFEVILKQQPLSNVLQFSIQTKELDLFYQPPLTEESKANKAYYEAVCGAVTYTETAALDAEGNVVVSRPENVIKSYAAYHKTGRNNYQNRYYKTGKAFHIYRPDATDSEGTHVWCDLNIDEVNGLMTITIPQDFLDKAVYPVIVDPTWGYTSIGATASASGAIEAIRFTAAAEDGDITKLTTYGSIDSGTTNLTTAIYLNNGSGEPDVRAAIRTSTVGVTTTPAWLDTPLTYSFTASTVYHLCFHFEATAKNYQDSGAADQHHFKFASYDAWNDPLGAPSGSSATVMSIYATYDAAVDVPRVAVNQNSMRPRIFQPGIAK